MPAGDAPLEAGGTTGGFRVTETPLALRIELWGYWTPQIVGAFERNAPSIAAMVTPSTVLLLHALELKPQGADGQHALRTFFRPLAATTFAKATLLTQNAMSHMQLTRLLRECGLEGRFGFSG